eukprot:COSAG01_NODE_4759_length_4760_cov_2.330401_5_plen_36_part_00
MRLPGIGLVPPRKNVNLDKPGELEPALTKVIAFRR